MEFVGLFFLFGPCTPLNFTFPKIYHLRCKSGYLRDTILRLRTQEGVEGVKCVFWALLIFMFPKDNSKSLSTQFFLLSFDNLHLNGFPIKRMYISLITRHIALGSRVDTGLFSLSYCSALDGANDSEKCN